MLIKLIRLVNCETTFICEHPVYCTCICACEQFIVLHYFSFQLLLIIKSGDISFLPHIVYKLDSSFY